jgi:hypothetical protein
MKPLKLSQVMVLVFLGLLLAAVQAPETLAGQPVPDSYSLQDEASAPDRPINSPPFRSLIRPAQADWGGRWPWTSHRLIRPEDLWPLSLPELGLMRNEIYARHGWVFSRRDLRAYFSSQPWYYPKGDLYNREEANRLVEEELSPLERRNIRIIVAREQALRQ